ncbi:hypothetical protein GGI23_001781 [Coemansia sp. RSA 2559]|nr:hypothetical protein GGI23_001781 [Coemansia sp. RSA 2559]
MESFYLVGANPDQSASIYGTVAATPRTASPLHTLHEVDEETPPPPQEINRDGHESNKESTNESLQSENQRLQRLLFHMNERIRTLESAAQENTILKSSIHSFREEFHRHANIGSMPRINKHSPGLRHGSLLISNANAINDEYVRQLEQQVHLLQQENAKQ